MTNPGAAAGSAPASKSLPARFVGAITSPRDTFQGVAAAPKILGMLATTTVIIALFTALPLTTEAGRQSAIDKQVAQMQSFGFQVNDDMYQRLQKGAGRMPYTTGISVLIVSPIFAAIFAGILFAIFNAAMGGEASFKQVMAVLVHAGAISALSAVFTGVINYFRGAMDSVTTLGSLLPMLPEHSFVANLLGAIDVFLIWYILVLSIGLAVLYRRRTQPIAMSLLSVYAVIALVIAVIKSRAGGA
jgi:Yip1 domain